MKTIASKNKKDSKETAQKKEAAIPTKIEVTKFLSGKINAPTIAEFEKLVSNERLRNNFTTIQGGLKENRLMNLNKEILPYDHTRVKLSNNKNRGGYVNASWVSQAEDEGEYDAIMNLPYLPFSQIGIIVSNVPTEATFNSHYQMIYDNDVNISICISNIMINRDVPNLGLREESFANSLVIQTLIKTTPIGRKLLREEWDLSMERCRTNRLVHFELKDFSLQSKDAIEQMLTTIVHIRKEMGIHRQKLIISIQDEESGVSEAAIFVALLTLLEQVDEALLSQSKSDEDDQTIDIFKTVNELRSKRMQMVKTFNEYQFIYQAVDYYVKNKTRYDGLLTSILVSNYNDSDQDDVSCNETSKTIFRDEEDDIYLTNPQDVRKILNQEEDDIYLTNPDDVRNMINVERNSIEPYTTNLPGSEDNFHSKNSTLSIEQDVGEYVLSKHK